MVTYPATNGHPAAVTTKGPVEFSAEHPEQSLSGRFEKIARMFPDRLAVKAGDRCLTYDELNRKANRIARSILQRRGPAGELIALQFEHGIDAIAAILGALKAGKSCVPLDPSVPHERTAHILADSQAGLFVTNDKNAEGARRLTRGAGAWLSIDAISESLSSDDVGADPSLDDPAIMTYTSGSTGAPKGVARSHRSFLHAAAMNAAEMHIGPDDRLSLFHSLAFRSAYRHFFSSLLYGAALFPFDIKSEGPHRLANWLKEEQITICHLPLAVFRQLAGSLSGRGLSRLRLINLSGAPVSRQDFDLYKATFPKETFLSISMGSTETGGICFAVLDQSFSFPTEGSPVGYPTPGKEVFLLDESGQKVAPGEVGEIAVRDGNLNSGYWNQPELTGATFISDPNGGREPIYLTGDLGRMTSDGFVIHLGRKDFMVKIRGYRVELAEIEQKLLSHPGIKDAAVVAWDRDDGEKLLAAYFVPRGQPAPTPSEVRRFLRGSLPEYMSPATFQVLESLPLTNGKVDRATLPRPDRRRPDMDRPYAAPRSELEQKLARIWEEVLEVGPIGADDNFFDLGGHSMTGARLMARIQRDFQFDLPLRVLFECPTIGRLARCVAEARSVPNTPHAYLVELQSGDPGRAPVFFFPGGGGSEPEFFVYARIARLVGAEYSFFALRAPGTDGMLGARGRVEEIAAAYIQEIRTIQPHGPYFLVGECFGGVVAHEVARRLGDEREKIALLALMDTQHPSKRTYFQYLAGPWIEPITGNYFVRRLPFHWKALRALEHRDKIPYLLAKLSSAVEGTSETPEQAEAIRKRAHDVVELTTDKKTVQRIDRYRERYRCVLRWHKPKPYPGRIEILVNEDFHRQDPTLGWERLALGGLGIHKLPGDHDSYIREHVKITAAKLRECLESAAIEVVDLVR